jgi:selenide,water dikinase
LPDKPPAGATGPEGPPKEPAPPLLDNEIVEFAEVVASDHPEDSPVEVIELDAIELDEIELEEIDDDEVIEVAELADEEPAEAVDDAAAAPKGPPPLPEQATKKPRPPRQIALIGAGHAHLQVLKWWKRHPIPRAEVTLVTAFDHAAYSAMLPSTLASLYPPTEMLIDLPKLCDHCGVRLIVDRANRLDPNERTIEFAHQPALTFDVASVNIGSVPAAEPLWQSHRILISVKPLSTFLQRFDVRFRELVEQWKMAPGPELLQIIVVGAGATGVEMALCLEQHKHELELPADVRLVDGNNSVLTEFSPGAVRRVEKLLKLRGIDLSLGSPVVDCDDEGPGHLVLENGTRIRADLVIWAAGAAPPMALRGFELPKSANGFLAARPTLQTTANAPVFISGDAADFEDFTIPKAGVFATRQAGVLWRNLRSFLAKRPLADYRPQSHFMRILSCGDGTAVLDYKGFSFHSGWAWSLKKWMDQKWVKQFRV